MTKLLDTARYLYAATMAEITTDEDYDILTWLKARHCYVVVSILRGEWFDSELRGEDSTELYKMEASLTQAIAEFESHVDFDSYKSQYYLANDILPWTAYLKDTYEEN
jgi:hypothetical protein